MLERLDGRLSRAVLRGLGGQQWPPGYPTMKPAEIEFGLLLR